eukprot:9368952-Karenia_brevis.AAC.1
MVPNASVPESMLALIGVDAPLPQIFRHAVCPEIVISALNAARHGVDPLQAARQRLDLVQQKVHGTQWELQPPSISPVQAAETIDTSIDDQQQDGDADGDDDDD